MVVGVAFAVGALEQSSGMIRCTRFMISISSKRVLVTPEVLLGFGLAFFFLMFTEYVSRVDSLLVCQGFNASGGYKWMGMRHALVSVSIWWCRGWLEIWSIFANGMGEALLGVDAVCRGMSGLVVLSCCSLSMCFGSMFAIVVIFSSGKCGILV